MMYSCSNHNYNPYFDVTDFKTYFCEWVSYEMYTI